jgi:hypothetical protein
MSRELQEDIESLRIEVDRKGKHMHECNLQLMDAERVYGDAVRRLEALRRQTETEGDANASGK